MMPAASTSAPRPGAAHAIDVAVASLLLQGDEVSPAAGEPSQRHLHALLPHAAASRAKAAAQVDDTDSADDGVISDPEECLVQEDRIETRLAQLKRVLGMGHDRTLKAAFKLMDCLIGQYKLNKTDEILRDFEKTCAERGGDWKVKWIQSTAFCRWKQYDFKEALRLFLQQQEIVGASAALCENIGHTYSSLGDLPQAEAYFERAIELLKRGSFGNRGGIYMGLGIVRDRLGKTRESLPILQQALEHYQKEHTSAGHVQLDSSIIAKAHMSLGRAHEKLGELGPAAKHMADALAIFRRTVGADSPLTANSMACLGKVKAARGEIPEAISLIKSALKLEVRKDAFHLETVWELLSRLKELHMEEARLQEAAGASSTAPHARRLDTLKATYAPYLPLVEAARRRCGAEHERAELGTLAVFYKTAAEIVMLAQDYARAKALLNEALRLFAKVPDFDCSSLVEGCEALLQIADANAR